MTKQRSLEKTRAQLRKLAFKQLEELEAAAAQLHTLLEITDHQPCHEHMEIILEWFMVAHTLRPADFKGVAKYICALLQENKPLPPQIVAALKNYTTLPPKAIRRHIISTERGVMRGNYDRYINKSAKAKYRAAVRATRKDPELKQAIAEFRERNPEFCAKKKVRRRTMAMERNFKVDDWYFEGTADDLVRFDLDSLCYRFNLFGLEDFCQTPLLQKLSVNATAYGIIIFIPRYWSFDYKRDLNWAEIKKLLKAWGMPRQGEAFSNMRLDSRKRAIIAYLAYEDAGKRGLRGQRRKDHAAAKAGLRLDMDERSFLRIVSKGKKLWALTQGSKKEA